MHKFPRGGINKVRQKHSEPADRNNQKLQNLHLKGSETTAGQMWSILMFLVLKAMRNIVTPPSV